MVVQRSLKSILKRDSKLDRERGMKESKMRDDEARKESQRLMLRAYVSFCYIDCASRIADKLNNFDALYLCF